MCKFLEIHEAIIITTWHRYWSCSWSTKPFVLLSDVSSPWKGLLVVNVTKCGQRYVTSLALQIWYCDWSHVMAWTLTCPLRVRTKSRLSYTWPIIISHLQCQASNTSHRRGHLPEGQACSLPLPLLLQVLAASIVIIYYIQTRTSTLLMK